MMQEDIEHHAGLRLKSYFDQQGISKEQAAEKLDMRVPQLQRILGGKNFRAHWLLRIKSAFTNLNLQWILTGEGEMMLANEIVPTEQEKEAVRIIDEARGLRNRVKGLPAKRKAELCGQVLDTATRLMDDNASRREKILNIRSMFEQLQKTAQTKGVGKSTEDYSS